MVEFPTITGATPINDSSGLRLHTNNHKEVEIAEAKNIAKAVTKYLAKKSSQKTAPFNAIWALKLHKEMYGDVWDWAGEVRKSQTNIGVAPHQIITDLHNLFEDLKVWKKSEMDLSEQAARLHHKVVFIHPFKNGNGRWSRMLADIWLKQNGAQPINWPSEIGQESSIRSEYIDAVKKADKQDFNKLIKMYEKYT